MLPAQLCFSKVSRAKRLNANAATVLSSRGAVMPQGQREQHQPVKSSPSTHIMRLLIHPLPMRALGLEQALPLGATGGTQKSGRARKVNSCPSPQTISHGFTDRQSN